MNTERVPSPQPLQGPGEAGPPYPPAPDQPASQKNKRTAPSPSHPLPPVTRKRRRTTRTSPATVGGCGPIPASPGGQTERSTSPDPTITFPERKNPAYEIWVFIRALETDDVVPTEQWPEDYDNHLINRPDSAFVGCKLCTQFG